MADSRKDRKAFQALFPSDTHYDELVFDLSRMTKRKQFKEWVFDMWRLWKSLTRNESAILLELFPQMIDHLKTNNELVAEIRALRDDIKNMQLVAPSPMPAQPLTTAPAIKTMNIGTIAMPTFDDEDDVVIEKKRDTLNIGEQVTANFLDNAFALIGDN